MDALIMTGRKLPSRREQGFALIFTLIILVVMVLSALGLMMITRGGITTAGNVAFRQAAVKVADVAAEDAFQWVLTNTATEALAAVLEGSAGGYYAYALDAAAGCTTQAGFTPQTYEFTKAGCAKTHGTPVSGYELYYVIHRMAKGTGPCSNSDTGCSGPALTSVCPPGSPADPQDPNYCKAGISTTHPYYRVTIKVVGPRHNSRYIQTFVY